MYQVYCDGLPLHDLEKDNLFVNNGSVSLVDNDSGQFDFKISPKHPYYDRIKKLKSVVTVLHNEVEIFSGRPTEERSDFYKVKKIVCKGELDYLTDSIQRPAEYHNMTVRGFLETLVEIHNAQVVEPNIAIQFNENCMTERSFDWVSLFYIKDGVVHRVLDGVTGTQLAGLKVVIPTLDFYIYFRSDSSNSGYYGFSIDSVEPTDDECSPSTTLSSIPSTFQSYTMTETSTVSDVQTAHNPYGDHLTVGWHFTKVIPSNYQGKKMFAVGQVTVTDSNDSLYRYTNYENTLQCIKEKLIKRLGGHLRIRKVDGVKYIDYLADFPNTNEQVIRFGKNLLDFSTTIDATDIATAIIPLGGKLPTSTIQALDERLTIKSVNNGSDFVYTQEAVDNFGWIFRTVTFDDVNVASNLKNKGINYLQSVQFENLVLSVTAVDLNNLDVSIERINLLDTIRVISEPHGLDRFFPVTKLKLSLDNPESDKITLGSETDVSFSSSNVSSNQDIIDRINAVPSERIILDEAIANATALIHAATHGHVVTTPEEILIMDTDDVQTATKVWRWNLNGFGYSNGGYNGSYVPAITMDGQIVGQRIVAGSIAADKLDAVYKTSVETQISTAQSNAESHAENYTDTALQPYWTSVQVQNAISVNGDGVLLSAKGYAENYTDTQLQSYTTTADLQVTLNGITSTVSQKLNSSDLSTRIQQSATDVKIAWNNISKYIQFANAELQIYDSANTSTQKLRSKLNDSGHHFYRDNYYVGKIGTNQWSGNSNHKGLVFDLEPNGKYMAFAQKASANDSAYTTILCFSRASSIYNTYGMHLGCDMDVHNNTIKNLYLSGVSVAYSGSNYSGYTGTIPIVTDVTITAQSGGGISWNISESKLRVSNGIIVGYWN